MTRYAIAGVRLSDELTLMTIKQPGADGLLMRLCRGMTEERINMPFVSLSRVGDDDWISFCVDRGDESLAEAVAAGLEIANSAFSKRPGVGLITLFPTKSSLPVLSAALKAFRESGLTVHGWCSSLSSLAFICDHQALDGAFEALTRYFTLPPNVQPMRPRIQVRQSRLVKPW
jgi:aspartokinase